MPWDPARKIYALTEEKSTDFFKKMEDISPFVGPLIPLLLTSGDICPGFESQGGSSVAYFVARITMDSSDSPLVQHLLTFWWPALQLSHFDPHTCTFRLYIIQEFVGIKPGIEFAEQCRVFVGEKLFTTKSQNYEAIKYFWTIQTKLLFGQQPNREKDVFKRTLACWMLVTH